jgi:ribonuclease HI
MPPERSGAAGERWITYTDGACAPSNPGPAGWGAVVIAPDGSETDHYGFIGPGTNQIAELTAALEGLSRVPPVADVELVSDSQYVLKGLTEWRAGWERKGFRNAKGEPVANLALWKKLFAAADARRVTTRWVRGHNGDVRNERADALANRALALRASSPR